jgi:hypothetical protein
VPDKAAYDPTHLAWTAALLAWVLAVPLFFVTKFATVVAHEGGHAIVATLLFRKVRRIGFDSSGGGGTDVAPPVPWLFNIAIGAAGYLGPSMFGLLAVEVLVRGAPEVVLWMSVVFLLVMLFVVRGGVGLVLVPALTAAIVLIAVKTHPPLQTLFAHMWVWFLLIAPVERMLLLVRRRDYRLPDNDTAKLGKWTPLPAEIWSLALLAGTIAALVYGGSLLLRHAGPL